MEILNLGNNSEDSVAPVTPKSKKLKVAKAAVGIGTLASLTGLGSTLAANISLNNDANVEFGQGVAQTAACDEDGFTITPVSYYDATSSVFRLDYVEVSGLNLTPIGTNWDLNLDASGVSQFGYTDIANAIAAHPGQYWDTTASAWTNTCDAVVLDFKAYTDNIAYAANTLDGYDALTSSSIPNTTSSPLMWTVYGNGGVQYINTAPGSNPDTNASNADVAIIFDSTAQSSNYVNKASIDHADISWPDDIDFSIEGDEPTVFAGNISDHTFNLTHYFKSDATIQFFSYNGHHVNDIARRVVANADYDDPIAGAIDKITVESMKYFPSDYYAISDPGPGVQL